MKIFWIVLLVLVLGAGAYVTFKPSGGKDLVNAPPAAEVAPPMNRGIPGDESRFFEDSPANGGKAPHPVAPAREPAPGPAGPKATPADQPPPPPANIPIEPAPAASTVPPNQGLTKEEMSAAVAKAKADAAKAAHEADAPPPASETPAPTTVTDAPADVKVAPQDDGSVLIDDKFTLRGEGTAEHPYEVSWDYLTSAEETYQPRLGKKTIPARLTMLNEKYVKISGYVAFPIMATEPTEMLSMLNQWDGCCIGVPPTPYDAIEVKLKKPAEGEDRLASYGSVSGKFRVDPYLVKDWLVSLYMMDEGEVKRE